MPQLFVDLGGGLSCAVLDSGGLGRSYAQLVEPPREFVVTDDCTIDVVAKLAREFEKWEVSRGSQHDCSIQCRYTSSRHCGLSA